MAERSPVFELHIKPLFRILDRQHMRRIQHGFDLWDYDAVKQAATAILSKVGGPVPTMPTADSGGPWPSEWVAVFQRWKDSGFRRLSLGVGKNYKLAKTAGLPRAVLSCKVDIPDTPEGDSVAWLDLESVGPPQATYRLVIYPGEADPPPAQTTEVECRESVDQADADAGIVVIDANGSHSISLTA